MFNLVGKRQKKISIKSFNQLVYESIKSVYLLAFNV